MTDRDALILLAAIVTASALAAYARGFVGAWLAGRRRPRFVLTDIMLTSARTLDLTWSEVDPADGQPWTFREIRTIRDPVKYKAEVDRLLAIWNKGEPVALRWPERFANL